MPSVELPITPTRTIRTQRIAFGWLAAVFILVASGSLAAQFPVETDQSLFSIPRSQDDIHQVRLADQEIRQGEFEPAVERLQGLLVRGRKGLFETRPGMFQGMRSIIVERLRELPQAGLDAYEKLTRLEAGDLMRTAFVGRDFEGLRTLADRFPTSKVGRKARLRLGDLYLEAGRGDSAANEYARLLHALAAADPVRGLVRQRLDAATTLDRRRIASDDEILALLDDDTTGIGWPAYGGGYDGTDSMELPRQLGEDAVKFQLSSPGYGSYYPLAVHATGGLGGLYFNTGHQVVAYDPVAARIAWKAPGPMVGSFDAEAYYETLNREILLSVAVSPDVVVAALQVPNTAERRSFHQLDITYKLPSRRLFGFDRHTGKRLWAHWDYESGPRSKTFVAHNAPAPPIIDGDTVYAPTNDPTGAIACYLCAYDLKTGEPKWRTLICSSQGEVNMFGNTKVEYAATPVALHDGVLYGTTNLGLCFAADAATGRVRWCTSYPIIRMPRTRMRDQAVRQVFFANNQIVVSHGVMMCTPLDSENVLGFDIRTGEILWKVHWQSQARQQNHLKWILGVQRDELIMSGAGVVGIKIRPDGPLAQVRKIRSPQANGRSTRIAKGAVAGDYIVHPVPGGLAVFDAEGNAHRNPFHLQDTGNVLMVDGLVVSARANGVTVHLDHEGLIGSARAAIEKDPTNPSHYLQLAMLMRGGRSAADMTGDRGDQTVRLLRRGIAAATKAGFGPEAPVVQSLTAELFKISMVRADAEIASGKRERALEILAAARDESRDPDNWISAQLKILAQRESDRKIQRSELERLAHAHPTAWHRFPAVGRMQVRPYVLWKLIPLIDNPGQRIERSQELLENYPEVHLETMTGREYAIQAIDQMIAEHGRKSYAAVEARAGKELTAVGEDIGGLKGIDRRFPHSEAAAKARSIVLDQAVLRGDLGTAVAMVDSGKAGLSAGMLRRLMVAAEKAGNAPLAHALGTRLLRDHRTSVSDFAPDRGAKMGELVTLPPLPLPETVYPALPSAEVGRISFGNRSRDLVILQVRQLPGYPQSTPSLLYLSLGGGELVAFDLAKSLTEPAFSIKARLRLHVLSPDDPILLCGDHLILNEGDDLRAIHSQTGADIWTQPAGDKRTFQLLGVQSGIVHAFSTLSDHGDGGSLVGFDALSGARLFDQPCPPMRETIQPRPFLGDLWSLHVPRGSVRVEIHRIDGITGRAVQRLSLPTTIQAQLGLDPDSNGHIRLRRVQDRLLVDADNIYLCCAIPRRTPMIAALRHDGALGWTWTSTNERSDLNHVALHASGLVLLETVPGRDPSGSLLVLDKQTGRKSRGTSVPGMPRLMNRHMEPFAPDQILLEIRDEGTEMLCFSLTDKIPSFRYPLHQKRLFWHYPFLGETFLATPVLEPSREGMELLVIDLATRRGVLPDGQSFRPLPNRDRGCHVVPHGEYVLCQTQHGIHIYGDKRKSK